MTGTTPAAQNAVLVATDEKISALVRTAEELYGLDTCPGSLPDGWEDYPAARVGPDPYGPLVYLLGTGSCLPVAPETIANDDGEPPWLEALVLALWPDEVTCLYCEQWTGRPAVQLPVPKGNLLAPARTDIVVIPLCDGCAGFLDNTYPDGEFLIYPRLPEGLL